MGSSLPPVRVLGRYAMYERFAAGGMATVHFGRLRGTAGFSRPVAVKRLHAHLSEDPEFVAMFLDEARLAARIQHPNVIQTLDVESSEGELFVVLDYVHGDSLARLVHEARRVGAPVTAPVVAAILAGVLEGLHAAHEARDANGEPLELVHRDVSPHNVLVGTDGVARVLDFGVAKARGRAQTTRGGQLKGKLAYMAPEQLRGKATRQSDVFAASVVLWEALAGRRLFEGDDDGAVIDAVLHDEIPPLRRYDPHVAPALEATVMRGLERDTSRRFTTAREMATALQSHGALATPTEVGAFVERLGGASLARRAARLAEIEAGLADGSPSASEAPIEASAVRLAATSALSGTPATAPIPGLARDNAATTVDPPAESGASGVATVSDVQAARGRRLVSAVSVAALIGSVATLAVAWSLRSQSAATIAATAPLPSETTSLSPSSSAPLVPSVDVSATDDSPESHPAPAAAPSKRAPAPRPRPRSGCSPAYTIDARGVHRYKPECL